MSPIGPSCFWHPICFAKKCICLYVPFRCFLVLGLLVYRTVFGTEGIGLRSVSYRFCDRRYRFGIDLVSEPTGSPQQNGTSLLHHAS